MSDVLTVSIPRITTQRLLLRESRRSDFEPFAQDTADPLARAHIGVHDRRTAWRILNASVGAWVIDGAGWWMVEQIATGAPLGLVGAFYREGAAAGPGSAGRRGTSRQRRTGGPGEGTAVPRGELELSWTIFRQHWGQGFATEAAVAALAFAFDTLGEREAVAYIDPANHASMRVAEHLGMTLRGDAELYGATVGRYVVEKG